MARRIAGVGWVTVSLRRSTKPDPPVGAVAGAMPSMLLTTASGSSSLASAGRAQRTQTLGGVGQFRVDRRHASEEIPGPGDVAGPLVQIGQYVPLPEVAIAGIAEVSGRPRGREHQDG